MSLLFNMLSRLVITFLPRSKRLFISWLQSLSAVILEPPKTKSATISTVSLFICYEVMRPDAMIFVFWMLSFKPTFSLCSFTFIKRLFYELLVCRRDSLVAQMVESAWNVGDLGSTPGSGRSPGERNGNPLQYSCLENPMDRGAWPTTVHGSQRVRHDWVTSFSLFTYVQKVKFMNNVKTPETGSRWRSRKTTNLPSH